MTNGESVAKSRVLPVFPLSSVGVRSDGTNAILTPVDVFTVKDPSSRKSLKARSPSISESAALADNGYLERAGGSECYAEIELT
ncbi:hypothetical protein GE21DRAFT_3865 [Neurospora crassa]|uniref:Uncharacterized protein n=1 Tax=Neurospora crassa (strain ATCC 24698 / 74-OR23-1A / CBS 708.71 / DSM 1257 / FGSC 987) TaxID=367110 RepID=Q7SAX2_NEUCR|nr:hypothetical protein NCU05662 [Neurospora crassa OR74A]EAA33531.1 hypothetical protein NCU05662 [Neurospora crassa OR74A]KHE83804.1 hypothetical protein GE21DRAFT_3865 [Neurospora crassa]|eukprot:XP_962767.1 hypothetical protein NCU05662 [Neurospora crassa OR74A]